MGIILLAILVFLFLVYANFEVIRVSRGRLYSDVEKIPYNRVGLVLGAPSRVRGGVNLYFKYRVQAATELYNAGKIDYILVSGDNSSPHYNEPMDFKRALIKNGIPPEKIYLDYAGFRTLDSIIRAKEIFGLKRFTIITQRFHNERAVYIAVKKGIDAIGFNARDVKGKRGTLIKLREIFARAKAVLDIWMGVGPKYLGKKITIGE